MSDAAKVKLVKFMNENAHITFYFLLNVHFSRVDRRQFFIVHKNLKFFKDLLKLGCIQFSNVSIFYLRTFVGLLVSWHFLNITKFQIAFNISSRPKNEA